MKSRLGLIGVPSGAGACGVGQEEAPSALREAGLIANLSNGGFQVNDLGDSRVVPWRPDRRRPNAQNLETVVDVVHTTADRVARALTGGNPLASPRGRPADPLATRRPG